MDLPIILGLGLLGLPLCRGASGRFCPRQPLRLPHRLEMGHAGARAATTARNAASQASAGAPVTGKIASTRRR
jgi:hypothetical protein